MIPPNLVPLPTAATKLYCMYKMLGQLQRHLRWQYMETKMTWQHGSVSAMCYLDDLSPLEIQVIKVNQQQRLTWNSWYQHYTAPWWEPQSITRRRKTWKRFRLRAGQIGSNYVGCWYCVTWMCAVCGCSVQLLCIIFHVPAFRIRIARLTRGMVLRTITEVTI